MTSQVQLGVQPSEFGVLLGGGLAPAEPRLSKPADEAHHHASLDLLLERRTQRLSLMDAVSVVTMRQRRVAEAFAFDPLFEHEAFSLVS